MALDALEARLWEKVHIDDPDDCWHWTAGLCQGYGLIWAEGRKMLRAHRVVYELLVGPIPDGLELDHLCHSADASCPGGVDCPHRACVNPAHLEPVTHRINLRRGEPAKRTHCPRGHRYTPRNTVSTGGKRKCRICDNARKRVRRAKARMC